MMLHTSGKSIQINQLAIWLVRKETCISAIYESVFNVPDALEIVEQYIYVYKEILPASDPQTEPLASDVLEKLVNQFCGKIQDELGNLN